MKQIEKLNQVLQQIKDAFVGKDDIVDLLGIALLAKENAFLLGPPGTAKSALIRSLSGYIEDGNNFEYLLTRFTEPNELFGPFDIRKLKEGDLETNTSGMMPEAALVFLDEIFNANSAILNSLLTALNERIFRRGKETKQLPALMFVGASNQLPEDEALAALLDRFLIRIQCGYVPPEKLGEVLVAGWKLEGKSSESQETIQVNELKEMQEMARTVNLSAISEDYLNLIHSIRNAGIIISDRRAVKFQNIIASSALICGRTEAIVSDLWVLKYIWDTEEQIEILEGIVNTVIEKDQSNRAHPQAFANKAPNADELYKEVVSLSEKWVEPAITLEERNVIKDKLRYVQTRCEWIQDRVQRQYVQDEIDKLWKEILAAV